MMVHNPENDTIFYNTTTYTAAKYQRLLITPVQFFNGLPTVHPTHSDNQIFIEVEVLCGLYANNSKCPGVGLIQASYAVKHLIKLS